VLHRHHGGLREQPTETGGVDSLGGRGIDAKPAHVFEPIEQPSDVRRRRRFGEVSQPGESGAPQRRIEHQQIFERLSRRIGQPLSQGLEHPLASAHSRGEPNSLQHRRGRDEHALGPQVRKHGLHDRLAAVSRPGGVGADLQASAPIRQAEAAHAKPLLQFDGMLPSRLVAERVVGKGGRRNVQLPRDKGDHRLWRMIAEAQALARMPQ
jgi:hypothetical protein